MRTLRSRRLESPVFATFTGIVDRFLPAKKDGELDPNDRLDGKTAFVTGACGGLGLAIARGLARRGARVLMGCRGQREPALRSVADVAASAPPKLVQLDLSSLAATRETCASLATERLDVVVLNAGVVPSRARRTEDGYEEGFQVNYLANVALLRWLLARGVIPNATFARATPPSTTRPRVVFISSEAHRSGKIEGWEELGRFYDYGMRAAVAEYGRTKLLLTTYAQQLARRLGDDVGVYALCPGAVNTNIAREAPAWAQPLLGITFRLFFAPPDRAVDPVLYLACAPRLAGETGVYLHRMTRKDVSEAAASAENGSRLWEATERLLAGSASE